MSRYNSNFNSHVSADKKKWALVTISIVLLVVLITGIITEGFREWNPWCWFGHTYEEGANVCAKCGKEKPVEVKPDEEPAEGAVIGESKGDVMALASRKIARANYAEEGISPLAESAYQLTATITPADASIKKVSWRVFWKNASSTWASGKTVTDYVTVTPTSEGSLTANVECLQAFGEQVIVRVVVRDCNAVEATVTVDYYKRATSFTADLSMPGFTLSNKTSGANGSNPALLYNSVANAYSSTYEQQISIANLTPVFGVGTIDGSYTCTGVSSNVVDHEETPFDFAFSALPSTKTLIDEVTGFDLSSVGQRSDIYSEYGKNGDKLVLSLTMIDSVTGHSLIFDIVVWLDFTSKDFFNPATGISLNPGSLKF